MCNEDNRTDEDKKWDLIIGQVMKSIDEDKIAGRLPFDKGEIEADYRLLKQKDELLKDDKDGVMARILEGAERRVHAHARQFVEKIAKEHKDNNGK